MLVQALRQNFFDSFIGKIFNPLWITAHLTSNDKVGHHWAEVLTRAKNIFEHFSKEHIKFLSTGPKSDSNSRALFNA